MNDIQREIKIFDLMDQYGVDYDVAEMFYTDEQERVSECED